MATRVRRAGRRNSTEDQPPDVAGRSIPLGGKRQFVEGVIGQPKDRFGSEHHRAKTLQGLLARLARLARLAAKVIAYTCGQVFNARLGRPLRHSAALLV